MNPFRLRLAALLLIVFGLIPFGFAYWISTWPRANTNGPGFVMPGNSGTFVKAEILPLLGQIGGVLIGLGLVMFIFAAFAAARQRRAIAAGEPLPERPKPSAARLVFSMLVAVVIVGGFLFWRWYDYIENAQSPYDEVGIGLTGLMPEPVRQWGCNRMHERFKNAFPPMGCGDATGRGWK